MTAERDINVEFRGRHCNSCGKEVDMTFHGACRQCIIDDFDEPDDDFDPEGPAFECAGYYPDSAGEFYCPLWGSEECDWECPHGGLAP